MRWLRILKLNKLQKFDTLKGKKIRKEMPKFEDCMIQTTDGLIHKEEILQK